MCRGLRSRTAGPPRRTARGWPAAASPRPGRWCSRAAARAGLTACPGAAAAHICATTVHSWAGLLSLPLSPSCRARGVTHAFGDYARHTMSRADHVLITFCLVLGGLSFGAIGGWLRGAFTVFQHGAPDREWELQRALRQKPCLARQRLCRDRAHRAVLCFPVAAEAGVLLDRAIEDRSGTPGGRGGCGDTASNEVGWHWDQNGPTVLWGAVHAPQAFCTLSTTDCLCSAGPRLAGACGITACYKVTLPRKDVQPPPTLCA